MEDGIWNHRLRGKGSGQDEGITRLLKNDADDMIRMTVMLRDRRTNPLSACPFSGGPVKLPAGGVDPWMIVGTPKLYVTRSISPRTLNREILGAQKIALALGPLKSKNQNITGLNGSPGAVVLPNGAQFGTAVTPYWFREAALLIVAVALQLCQFPVKV